MYKYVKLDQNIPCGSRVMSLLTNLPRLAGLMLSKASSMKRLLRMTVVIQCRHALVCKIDQNIPWVVANLLQCLFSSPEPKAHR